MKLVILFFAVLFFGCREDGQNNPPEDAKSPYSRVGSGQYSEVVFTDPGTGCQYFASHQYMQPRLSSEGVPMCGISNNLTNGE
jgi:hypothetical protein